MNKKESIVLKLFKENKITEEETLVLLAKEEKEIVYVDRPYCVPIINQPVYIPPVTYPSYPSYPWNVPYYGTITVSSNLSDNQTLTVFNMSN